MDDKTCVLCYRDPAKARKAIDIVEGRDEKAVINLFLRWLHYDSALLHSINEPQKAHVHQWMIKYLNDKL